MLSELIIFFALSKRRILYSERQAGLGLKWELDMVTCFEIQIG